MRFFTLVLQTALVVADLSHEDRVKVSSFELFFKAESLFNVFPTVNFFLNCSKWPFMSYLIIKLKNFNYKNIKI